MNTPTANNVHAPPPLTVGVIGCGPAGMLFLRQVDTERERLADLRARLAPEHADYRTAGRRLASLPRVTVFERASRCGGLWRAKPAAPGRAAGMAAGIYDGMWSKRLSTHRAARSAHMTHQPNS